MFILVAVILFIIAAFGLFYSEQYGGGVPSLVALLFIVVALNLGITEIQGLSTFIRTLIILGITSIIVFIVQYISEKP